MARFAVFALLLAPVVGVLYPFVDGFLIFRNDRRRLHDLIAGTKVALVIARRSTVKVLGNALFPSLDSCTTSLWSTSNLMEYVPARYVPIALMTEDPHPEGTG